MVAKKTGKKINKKNILVGGEGVKPPHYVPPMDDDAYRAATENVATGGESGRVKGPSVEAQVVPEGENPTDRVGSRSDDADLKQSGAEGQVEEKSSKQSNTSTSASVSAGIDSIQYLHEVSTEDMNNLINSPDSFNGTPNIVINGKNEEKIEKEKISKYLSFLVKSDLHPSSQVKVMVNGVGLNCGNPVSTGTGCNLPTGEPVIFLCGVSLDADINCSTSLHFKDNTQWTAFRDAMKGSDNDKKFIELVNLIENGNHAAWKPYSQQLINTTKEGGRRKKQHKGSRQKQRGSVKNNRGKTHTRLQRSRKNRNKNRNRK